MRFGFAVSSVSLVLLPLTASASQTSEAAQAAVRDLLSSSTGISRVFFSDVKEVRLSGGEVRVTGEGVSSERDSWGGVPFRFSINIRESDFNSRNGMIEFRDGRKFGSQSDWGRHINRQGNAVTFNSPRWYETLSGQEIRFSGRCSGPDEVRLSIYDRSGRVVREGRSSPDRSGQWMATIRLDQGDYRAVAHRRGWSDGDEVRFAVGRASGNWGEGSCWTGYRQRGQWDRGWMDSAWGSGSWGSGSWHDQDYPNSRDFSITSPRQNESVRGNGVVFRGTSREDLVTIRVYDGSRRIQNERVQVDRNGEWQRTITLDDGRYRVELESGRESRELNISVRGGPGDYGDRSFNITSPRQNESVRGNGVVFRGTSRESVVTIRVYEGSRRIQNERVQVDRNGEWQRTITLDDGRYRVELESGRESRELNISVRGNSGGSGGGGSFSVTGPRQNEVVRSNRVAFQGFSRERTIYISVYEGGRRIERETVSVDSSGEWTRVVTLDDGRYRAVVESGRDSRTLDFEVRGGSGGSGGGGSFSVTGPRQNEVVRSSRVYFQGSARESSLSITVYRGSRQAARESVQVERDGRWGRVITLENGQYRAVIQSGRDRREVNFEVRS